MENILPVSYPFVRGLPDHAFYLSVIGDNSEKWIGNQYINITCNKNFNERKVLGFDFYIDYNKCPYINVSEIPACIIEHSEEALWKLVCDLIDDGYYLAVGLDENLIYNRQYYQSGQPVYHNNFIYGYDNERVYLGGFNRVGKYIFEPIEKKLFLKTFKVDENIKLIVIKTVGNERYDINEKYILRCLKDYISGTDLAEEYAYVIPMEASTKKAFGWNVYEYMIDYYSSLEDTGLNKDHRPLFMMGEQKKCMIKRLEILEKRWDISLITEKNMAFKLHQELEKALNYFLKYMYTHDKKCLAKVKLKLEECQFEEKDLYYKLIEKFREMTGDD